jgi:hypothetical protein
VQQGGRLDGRQVDDIETRVGRRLAGDRNRSMPRSSPGSTFSSIIVCTCCSVKPRSFRAITRLSRASWDTT